MPLLPSIARLLRTRLGVAVIAASSLGAVLFFWSSQRTSARDDADTTEVSDNRAPDRDAEQALAPIGSLRGPVTLQFDTPLPPFDDGIDFSDDLDIALFSPRPGASESTSLLAQLDLQDHLFGLSARTALPSAEYVRRTPLAGAWGGFGGGMSGGFAGGGGGGAWRQPNEEPSHNADTAQANTIASNTSEPGVTNTGNGGERTGNGPHGGPGNSSHDGNQHSEQNGYNGHNGQNGQNGQSGSNGPNGESGPNGNTAVKVPEPSVLVLTSLGFAALAAARRRRTRSIDQ